MKKNETNSLFYCDYNATAPLAQSVKDFLAQGDFHWGNPSSVHTLGRQAKKSIHSDRDYLYEHFSLSPRSYDLFFHSGATEGITSFFRSSYLQGHRLFACAPTDHPAVIETLNDLQKRDPEVDLYFLPVTKEGDLLLEKSLLELAAFKNKPVINFTPVQNETGVVWPWCWAEELVSKLGAIIHADCAQLPGKIEGYSELPKGAGLGAFTFSGHKFGALKSVGFSFLKKENPFRPMLIGGGQQDGLRSGTENAMGVHSLVLALKELKLNLGAPGEAASARRIFEGKLQDHFGGPNKVRILGSGAGVRANQTVLALFSDYSADQLLAQWDLLGVCCSRGSACSSGLSSGKNARGLLALGTDREEAKRIIRFSFSFFFKKDDLIHFKFPRVK